MVDVQGGRMSLVLDSMKIGDTMDVKGPLGHFVYEGHGRFRDSGKPGTCTHMSMVAGGTGITPLYQIIKVNLALPGPGFEYRLQRVLRRCWIGGFADQSAS